MPRKHRSVAGLASAAQAKTPASTLIVGLDIGTTFSGASWTLHAQGSHERWPAVHVIESWPHKSGQAKVPTQIAFSTPTLRPNTNVFWGYGIPDLESRASWIKLLLLDDKDLPADLRASDQFKAAKNFLISTRAGSGTDLMSEYLRVFWSHVIGSITQALGEEAVEAAQLKIVVTIPAIWPHYAQSRMAAAVEEAGITTHIRETSLTFMSEPEAAALSNFYDDRRYMQQRLAVNDTFVICDAGGGTVDLIAYRVVECTSRGLEIEEVMPGKGKLCGATFLDAAFEKLLLSHFGEGWKTVDLDERQRVMEDAWERRIKPNFDGNDTFARLDVQVPASCRYHARQSERQRKLTDPFCSSYTFTRDEIASVFDPVVSKIVSLISEQIHGVFSKMAKRPKYIIMSGGFGQSKYLHQKVKAMLAMNSSDSTLLGTNSSSWSDVSRGAVLQGLSGYLRRSQAVQIRSRVSRASYGTLQYETFDDNTHDQRDKAWSEEEGGYVAVDQPVWFLKYGDVIAEGSSTRFEFYSLHPVSSGLPRTHEVMLFHCHDSIPPTRLDASVTELCTIEWSDDSRSYGFSPEIVENDMGENHYAVCFDVEMVVRGAGLEFAVLVDGKKVAAKNVNVQYTTPDSHPKTTKRPSGMTRVAASARGSQPEPQWRQRRALSPVQSVKMEDSPSTKRKRESNETSARLQPRKKRETWASDEAYEEGDVRGSWGPWGA